jgi:sulfite reductase alpha subunit-like flavoprotein
LNSSRFWNRLSTKEARNQVDIGVKFTVFGLGDSKYAQFNYAARKIYGRMMDLGAHPICQLGCGDEQHSLGVSQEFIPWVNLLWNKLFGIDYEDSRLGSSTVPFSDLELTDSNKWSYGRVVALERMTSESHSQEVRRIELDLIGGWNYEAGDVLAVLPYVAPEIASTFILEVLGESPERRFGGFPLQKLFTEILDISAVPSHLLYEAMFQSYQEQMNGRTLQEEEKRIMDKLSTLAAFSAEGAFERLRYSTRERLGVWEVLKDFHQVKMPLEKLVVCLNRITPRYYSVCSPVKTDRKMLGSTAYGFRVSRVEIVVGMVEYTTLFGRHRKGLASEYFKSLEIGSFTDRVWLERGFNPNFNNKVKSARSLLMFGPGTGIAPLRAITQSHKDRKRILLFTGFRSQLSDFLFRGDIKNHFRSDQVAVVVAWSQPAIMDTRLAWSWSGFGRDLSSGPGCGEGRKTWVQDLIETHRIEIEKIASDESLLIVIAGRSHPMPQQILTALELVAGKERIDVLIKRGRIVYDTWG